MTSAVRQIWAKAVKHGRQIFRNVGKNGGQEEILENEICNIKPDFVAKQGDSKLLSTRLRFWDSFTSQRGAFTPVAELRRRAVARLASPGGLQAGRVPNLALVGFGIAVGSKLYGPVDEHGFNLGCHHIKEWFCEQSKDNDTVTNHMNYDVEHVGVEDFQFSSLIGKGCNAVVYAAKMKTRHNISVCDDEVDKMEEPKPVPIETCEAYSSSESSFIILNSEDEEEEEYLVAMETVSENESLATDQKVEEGYETAETESFEDDSLAIKMIFNFDMESNAVDIMQGLGCEIIPAQHISVSLSDNVWHNGNHVKKKKLKPHPNIVEILDVFVDQVPDLPGAHENFPDALPRRLNPDGFGRNATLFLVMKRYPQTLQQYLKNTEITMITKTILLTQLTEAVVHLSRNNIAHRDIKADNILVREGDSVPHLVLTDFGCCLSQQSESLRLAYFNDYVSKGGNGALMAPEIACTKPGFGVYLDYTKSDLWAVGAIAYEIFGIGNPFYRNSKYQKRLDSRTFQDEDLPTLPENVPDYMDKVVRLMTRRNPKQRASPTIVANMLHIILWGPKEWRTTPPSEQLAMQWLASVCAGCILANQDVASVEFKLKTTFLSRLVFKDLMTAAYLLTA